MRRPHATPSGLVRPTTRPELGRYTADTYAQLAAHFGIWTVPRATHRHTAVLRWRNNTFVLASARRSPYLPEQFRQLRPSELRLVAGGAGESCTAACSRASRVANGSTSGSDAGARLECDRQSFEWANQVEELASHFPCERGFATVTGPDIPNYVVQAGNEYYQRCLVSEGGWACDAHHSDTRRLCPCTPLVASAARSPTSASSTHGITPRTRSAGKLLGRTNGRRAKTARV